MQLFELQILSDVKFDAHRFVDILDDAVGQGQSMDRQRVRWLPRVRSRGDPFLQELRDVERTRVEDTQTQCIIREAL